MNLESTFPNSLAVILGKSPDFTILYISNVLNKLDDYSTQLHKDVVKNKCDTISFIQKALYERKGFIPLTSVLKDSIVS